MVTCPMYFPACGTTAETVPIYQRTESFSSYKPCYVTLKVTAGRRHINKMALVIDKVAVSLQGQCQEFLPEGGLQGRLT